MKQNSQAGAFRAEIKREDGEGLRMVEGCEYGEADIGAVAAIWNEVVAANANARHLYGSPGFVQLGIMPGGFRMLDGTYADICPYYRNLV